MKKLCDFMLSKKGTAVLIVSAALTAAICLVMNLFLIPAIEREAGGLACFDMRFGYGEAYAQGFLYELTPAGRALYLTRQLPLDFFYPLAYLICFCGLILKLRRRADALLLLPALLALTDYAENLCILAMLRADELPTGLAVFSGVCTSVKTVLMYLVFAVLAALAIGWAVRRKKEKARAAASGKDRKSVV